MCVMGIDFELEIGLCCFGDFDCIVVIGELVVCDFDWWMWYIVDEMVCIGWEVW